jgi:CheY-like chemotaxis protein
MPGGGKITIETENALIDESYARIYPWARAGQYVLLSVTDTGCGMNEATREHMFEPFFTTKEEGQGTGLGMATTYGIIKQHSGMIHVYSEVGKGTTVRIYLPLDERNPSAVDQKTISPVRGGTEGILLAEDDEAVRDLAVRVLERAGYRVFTAVDGLEAIRVFSAHADEISLALLDVVMPTLNGREAYERIGEIKPGVRVLFTSGYSADAIHTKFVLDEGLELIQKPYGAESLLGKVREILDESE